MLLSLISIFLLLLYCGLIIYYRISWEGIPDYASTLNLTEESLPLVTIIIAARNEEKNIGRCIQSIQSQSYPREKFELIIVNDHSTDSTVEVIESFGKDAVRIINLADFTEGKIINSYKKKAIDTALQFAKGDLIITTDADCIVSEKWIETLISFYIEKKVVFIASPVVFKNFKKSKGFFNSFLRIFQQLDFMTLQGITGASVEKGFHNMCNGANLMYEKKVFFEVNGFEGIDEIASGDDMLLMHKIQKKYPNKIGFLKSKDAIVATSPEDTLSKFFNQRIRWASKAGNYTDKKITSVLLFVYFFNAWLLILGISAFFFAQAFYLLVILICIKIVVELFFLFPVAQFFNQQKLLWWFIPSEPFHILYTLIAGWLGTFGHYKWKERKVN